MVDTYDPEMDVILIGAGGHAKVIIEIMRKYHSGFRIAGALDNDEGKSAQKIRDVNILGTDDMIKPLYEKGLRKAFIALGMTGNYSLRAGLFEMVKAVGFQYINVIHGTSIISGSVRMGAGNAVMARALINTEAELGSNCIINSGSIIEHECIIGNNVHVAPGAVLSGGVHVGDNCLIGTGASVIQGIRIGCNSIIGAGSVVIRDIPSNAIAVGNPAKVIKER